MYQEIEKLNEPYIYLENAVNINAGDCHLSLEFIPLGIIIISKKSFSKFPIILQKSFL